MTSEIFNNPYISYFVSPAIVGVIVVYFLYYAISFGSFKERFKHLEDDVSVLKDDMKEVKKDITLMKVDITELKSDMSSVKDDLTIIKSILLRSLKS